MHKYVIDQIQQRQATRPQLKLHPHHCQRSLKPLVYHCYLTPSMEISPCSQHPPTLPSSSAVAHLTLMVQMREVSFRFCISMIGTPPLQCCGRNTVATTPPPQHRHHNTAAATPLPQHRCCNTAAATTLLLHLTLPRCNTVLHHQHPPLTYCSCHPTPSPIVALLVAHMRIDSFHLSRHNSHGADAYYWRCPNLHCIALVQWQSAVRHQCQRSAHCSGQPHTK